MESDDERVITAVILGALIPELQYAAPVLLNRYERGLPLVAKTSPADPGFEGGAVDPVLLEFFKALVPHVRELLGWGTLAVLPLWYRCARRDHAELIAALETKQRVIDRIAELLTRMDGAPVSGADVIDAITRVTREHA